jgi:sugar phosphate isomerase/epimerase
VGNELGPTDLVLCAYTIPAAGFRERVEVAASAGFDAISIRYLDYKLARQDGLTDAAVRQLLDDAGVVVADVDVLWEWAVGGERGERARHEPADRLRAVAAAVGARSVNAVSELDGPLELAAERFGDLCDRLARDDLLVHIEPLPWSSLRDVRTAARIASLAGRPNGGVQIDSWHYFRSGLSNADLDGIDPGVVFAVQLADAPAAVEEDQADETMHRRQLPGEGELGLVAFVRALDRLGVQAPLGVEVMSDRLAAMPVDEAARRAADALRDVVGRARGAAVGTATDDGAPPSTGAHRAVVTPGTDLPAAVPNRTASAPSGG